MTGKLGQSYATHIQDYAQFKTDIYLARYHHWKLERLDKIAGVVQAYGNENWGPDDEKFHDYMKHIKSN